MMNFRPVIWGSMIALLAVSTSPELASAGDRATGHFKKKKVVRENNSGGLSSFFNFSRRKQSLDEIIKRQEANRKPEKSPIYTYRADKLVTLGNTGLKQPAPSRPVFAGAGPSSFDPLPDDLGVRKLDDSLAQTIFDLLQSKGTSARVTASESAAIVAFYRKRNFAAVWSDMDGATAKALQTIDYLRKADVEGLDADDYRVPVYNEVASDPDEIASDLVRIARFDLELTAAALRYARHASGGRVSPNRLSGYHDLKPPRIASKKALLSLAKAERPQSFLETLHPSHKAYKALRRELVRKGVGQTTVAKIQIPAGPVLKPGDVDDRVSIIRKRLIQEGILRKEETISRNFEIMTAGLPIGETGMPKFGNEESGTVEEVDPAFFDDDLADAVRTFQKQAGLTPDAIVGPATLRAFNGTGKVSGTDRIAQNMERLRWMPRSFGHTHIFVNQPAYRLEFMRGDKRVWQTRVIVGKPKNQTSFFSDVMETVVFNPYWGVPQSILSKEMLPRLQANPGYLDQRGYEVYDRRGRKVSSSSVDWWEYSGKVPYSVRQKPGNSNALGKMKFLFPNKHAIYLHDTPSRSLFKRSTRALSHGCVRVQNPHKLAEAVLGWRQSKISSVVNAGENRQIPLNSRIHVHLTYFTAWPDDAGKISFYKDIYGRDGRLALALKSEKRAMQ